MPAIDKLCVLGSGRRIGIHADADLKSYDLGQGWTVSAGGAGGSFALALPGGTVTVPVGTMPCGPDGSSASGTLQAMLESVPGVGSGAVKVRGINPYRATFAVPQALLTVDSSGLLASVPADPTTAGSTASQLVAVSSRLGAWTEVVGGLSGKYLRTAGAGDSTTEARWRADGLAAGNYRVGAFWPGGVGYASNAKFRVYDGTTLRGVWAVDQRSLAGTDYNPYLNVQWVGTVYVAGGSLRLMLCDDADGMICADTIVVEPADPSQAATVLDWGPYGNTHSGYGWADFYNSAAWRADGRTFRSSDVRDYWTVPLRGVRAGTYRVEYNWAPDVSHNPAAPVVVTVDGVDQAPVAFDQRSAPSGRTHNNGSANVAFSDVGTYQTAGSMVLRQNVAAGGASDVGGVAFVRTALAGFSAAVTGSVSSLGSPSYRVNGGSPVGLSDVIWETDGTQQYLTAKLPTPVNPGDAVTFSAPAGAFLLGTGPSGALNGVTVDNKAGDSILAAFDPTLARPFGIGFNVGAASYYDPHQMFADLMRACPKLAQQGGTPLVLNDDGEVVSGTGTALLRTSTFNALDPASYRNLPPGVYTVRWAGAGSVSLGYNATLLSDDGTVGGMRQRRYTVAPDDGVVNVNLTVSITGPAATPQVYPPGVATDGSQMFWPAYLTQLQGARVLRSMTWFGGLFNTIIDESDLTPESQISWNDPESYAETHTVTAVGPYANGDGFFPPQGYLPALFTLAAPHNLVEMTMLTLRGPNGGAFTVPIVGGQVSSVDLNYYTIAIHYNPATMGPNQFAIGVQVVGTSVGAATNVGSAVRARRYCPPVSAFVALCNAVGADAWVNVPPVAPCARADATWTAVFRQVARTLAAGKKCYVEHSNEVWNSAFPPYHYFTQLANSLGTTTAGAGLSYAAHFHALARAAFVLESRDPNDVVRVAGTWTGVVSFTTDLAAYGQAHSVPIDRLALAPYLYVKPELQPGQDAAYDGLTTEEVLDQDEACMAWYKDSTRQNAGLHRAEMAKYGYGSVKTCCYEMGPAYARIGGTDVNQAKHSQGSQRHPRFRRVMAAYWAEQQAQGHDVGLDYASHGANASEGGASSTSIYNCYWACDCEAGKGDGTDGKADNRVNPWVLDGKVSVVGQSILDWNAPPSTPPPAPLPVYPSPSRVPARLGPGQLRTVPLRPARRAAGRR